MADESPFDNNLSIAADLAANAFKKAVSDLSDVNGKLSEYKSKIDKLNEKEVEEYKKLDEKRTQLLNEVSNQQATSKILTEKINKINVSTAEELDAVIEIIDKFKETSDLASSVSESMKDASDDLKAVNERLVAIQKEKAEKEKEDLEKKKKADRDAAMQRKSALLHEMLDYRKKMEQDEKDLKEREKLRDKLRGVVSSIGAKTGIDATLQAKFDPKLVQVQADAFKGVADILRMAQAAANKASEIGKNEKEKSEFGDKAFRVFLNAIQSTSKIDSEQIRRSVVESARQNQETLTNLEIEKRVKDEIRLQETQVTMLEELRASGELTAKNIGNVLAIAEQDHRMALEQARETRSREGLGPLADLIDRFKDISNGLKGIKDALGDSLLKKLIFYGGIVVVGLAGYIYGILRPFITYGKALFAEGGALAKVGQKFVAAAKSIGSVATKIFSSITKAFPIVGKFFGFMGQGASIVGKVFGFFAKASPFIGMLAKVLPAVFKVVAKIAWPLQILLSLIDAVMGVMKVFDSEEFKEGTITDKIFLVIKGALAGIIDGLTFGFIGFDNILYGLKMVFLPLQTIITFLSNTISNLWEGFSKLGQAISYIFETEGILGVIRFIPYMLAEGLMIFGTSIVDGIIGTGKWLIDFLNGMIPTLGDEVAAGFTAMADSVAEFIYEIAPKFGDWLYGLLDGIKTMLSPSSIWSLITGSEPQSTPSPATMESVSYDAEGNRIMTNAPSASLVPAGGGGRGGTITTVVNNSTTVAGGAAAPPRIPMPNTNQNSTYRRATSANYQ